MVTATQYDGQDAFACDVCGLHFTDRSTAEDCEQYCRENSACSSELTARSLERS